MPCGSLGLQVHMPHLPSWDQGLQDCKQLPGLSQRGVQALERGRPRAAVCLRPMGGQLQREPGPPAPRLWGVPRSGARWFALLFCRPL